MNNIHSHNSKSKCNVAVSRSRSTDPIWNNKFKNNLFSSGENEFRNEFGSDFLNTSAIHIHVMARECTILSRNYVPSIIRTIIFSEHLKTIFGDDIHEYGMYQPY